MNDLGPLLALLEERHGIGQRGELAGWMRARIERAVTAIGERRGAGRRESIDVLASNEADLAELADALRVGETSFYRDAAQWDALRAHVLPGLASRGRLAALSVGCSTGEEAWTLGMCVARARRAVGAAAHVAAVDRSALALESAVLGQYPKGAVRGVPRDLAEEFLVEGEDFVSVRDDLRALVRFSHRDAARALPPGRWSIVVCKNVLIYFGHEGGMRLVERLLGALDDGGVLVVARSEVPRVRAAGGRAEDVAEGVTVFRA